MINKNDKIFVSMLLVLLILAGGVVVENIHALTSPQAPNIQIDVEKVRAEIEQAGLPLHEAMYWEVIKR